jgi:15-cis-phytoene synthase
MDFVKTLTLRPIYERTTFHKAVISEVEDTVLRESYTFCREITRKHAKTFYLATRFLPKQKQRAIFAIYALCRYIDDTVDESVDLLNNKQIELNDIQKKLDLIKEQIIVTFNTGYATNPIFKALADSLKIFNISVEHPLLLLEGVYSDLFKNRYETFEEVYDYSYKVASVVGLMTSEVFGYTNKEALSYAIDLGIAMQLTNIIRDIGEDLERNRIYIPKEDMDAFDVSEADLKSGVLTQNCKQLLKFQVDRARTYYKNAEKGISMLERDSRLPVWLARFNYARILDKIEECDYNVLKKRVYLSATEKMSILPGSIFRSYLL